MAKRASQQKQYYFSDRLQRQLAQIGLHPLTVVEAPSGFGKTTAIREYLKENLPDSAREYWYTCLGESASAAWRGICELFSHVDDAIATGLRKLEMPTLDTLLYMTAILRNFRCEEETYLVIDNFQLVACDIPRELMSVFSMHGNSNLHMIFITQQLGPRRHLTIHTADIHTIDAPAFFFDREGTANLLRMEGIRFTESELESIYTSTEGWVSAICLQIINHGQTGSFDLTADIEQLVETAIWSRLTPAEQEFLLSVSVLESFTARQAAIMEGRETLSEPIRELLKSNEFIRYFPDSGIYTIHGILQDYLRNQFYQYRPEEFQRRILRLAGQSCVAISQYYPAARFFMSIQDYEAIFTIPFTGEYLANQREMKLMEYIVALVNECPEDVLCRHPRFLLMLAYPLLFDRQMEAFQKLSGLISRVIEAGDMGPEERTRLKGEFILLQSFTGYNDIRAMTAGRREALEILGGPSDVVVNGMPWTFGGTSVLNMFWREAGTLDRTLEDMDECLPYYLKLTHGHGTGADSVLRAETMLMRGEDDEAEMLCHRALYDARSYQQICICICAVQVLARIAIMRGDVEGYFTAIHNIQDYTRENSSLYVLRMVDLCMSVINFTMGITDQYAKWLYDTEGIKRTLCAPAIPYAQMLYSEFLLIEKRYSELFGISQSVLGTAREMRYMLPQVYQPIFLAVARRNMGRDREALEYLKEALALALPDRVFLPFAQQWGELGPLMETLVSGAVTREAGLRDGLADLMALGRRQSKGAAAIRRAILHTESPLTPREREIALLVRDRLSAQEIADRLFISKATARTITRNIYSKLDIHSRAELDAMDF